MQKLKNNEARPKFTGFWYLLSLVSNLVLLFFATGDQLKKQDNMESVLPFGSTWKMLYGLAW